MDYDELKTYYEKLAKSKLRRYKVKTPKVCYISDESFLYSGGLAHAQTGFEPKGVFRVKYVPERIAYSPISLKYATADELEIMTIHEFAHVANGYWPGMDDHGSEWSYIAQDMGIEPEVHLNLEKRDQWEEDVRMTLVMLRAARYMRLKR